MSIKYIIFHVLTVIQYMAATYYNANHIVVPNTEEFKKFHAFGGLAKYLTLWNMVVQVIFFWLCVLNDLFGSNEINPKSTPKIRKFKDILFCSIAFPLSAFVAITFWGLYAIDRELVLPRALDNYFPTWLNHIMHTNILIFTLIELVSSFRVYPERKTGILNLTAFMFVYLVWIFFIFIKSKQWVYPVMEVLNWPQRLLFLLALLICANGFYIFGEKLNNLVWSSEVKMVSESAVRKSKAH